MYIYAFPIHVSVIFLFSHILYLLFLNNIFVLSETDIADYVLLFTINIACLVIW